MSYVFRTIIAFPNPRYSVSAPRFREGNKTERFAGVPRDRQPRERFFLGNVSGDVSVASAEASIRTGTSATAQENGGAGILKQNPQQPVLYSHSVDWDARERATRRGSHVRYFP
jgi:hypothetical protein